MSKYIYYVVFFILGPLQVLGNFEPNWESLDSRPLPPWYDEAKIGIFLHWGVFSVPSFGSEWFWNFWKRGTKKYVDFMKENYPPGFTYQDFGPQFTAEFYDPDEWADLFAAAGAKYVVLTSKHHEGFTLWPSKHSWNWNAMDIGPQRDLLGDLANSIRNRTNIRFGLYHSLFEWYNRLFLRDQANNFTTNTFVTSKTMPELYELVNNYKPEIIWSDGDGDVPDVYWNSTGFLSWLFNDSPVKENVVVNDRWGLNIPCHHGSFYTCADRYNPGVLQPHKWENCMTLDKNSWGYSRISKANDYLTIKELLETMAGTISCGGNLLVNAGPTHDGRIPPIMEERFRQMGQWLKINGEAIYKSSPWDIQEDKYSSGIWYTTNAQAKAVYAIVLNWPKEQTLILGSVLSFKDSSVTVLGYSEPLMIKQITKGMEVAFPPLSSMTSQWAWVLKMEGVSSRK